MLLCFDKTMKNEFSRRVQVRRVPSQTIKVKRAIMRRSGTTKLGARAAKDRGTGAAFAIRRTQLH
eukprot:SAG31_NODE_5502_length_2497_cov_34.761885_2_plen_64_part_01